MKKLSLESIFSPEMPSKLNRHKSPLPSKIKGSNTFPYNDDGEEGFSEEEIESELGLMEFGLGKRMPSADNLSIGKMNGASQGAGKGSKGFANYLKGETQEIPSDAKAQNISRANSFDEEHELDDLDQYLANESLSLMELRGAREIATKELAPVSTKQPFANGLPSFGDEEDNPFLITGKSKEEEREEALEDEQIERDLKGLRMSLESIMEWADSDWSSWAAAKKSHGPKDDLLFFDELENVNPYLMNSEEDFKKEDEDEE